MKRIYVLIIFFSFSLAQRPISSNLYFGFLNQISDFSFSFQKFVAGNRSISLEISSDFSLQHFISILTSFKQHFGEKNKFDVGIGVSYFPNNRGDPILDPVMVFAMIGWGNHFSNTVMWRFGFDIPLNSKFRNAPLREMDLRGFFFYSFQLGYNF